MEHASPSDHLRAQLIRLAGEVRELAPERQSWAYSCAEDVVAREGVEYVPREVPDRLRRNRARKPHGCYQRAGQMWLRTWLDGEPLTYVEGFAYMAGDAPWPIRHAWLTDDGEHVIDLSWPEVGAAYVGVPLKPAGDEWRDQLGDSPLLKHGFGPNTIERAA